MEKKQYIRARVILEVLGKPKEHIDKSLKQYVEKIKQDDNLSVINTDFSESKQQEKDVWSTFAELEIVFKSLPSLVGFCFDYMPSSVEILKPENFVLNNIETADLINDLQARLHNVDMMVKKLAMENNFLKRNLKISLQNAILVLLKVNKLSKEQISKYTGIDAKEIEPFLNEMVKDQKIQKDGELYSLK